MMDTETTTPLYTDEDAKVLKQLQSVQKANYGRMQGARRAIESTDVKINRLQDQRWAAAPPANFLAEDDYKGLQELTAIHGSDEAHRYRAEYITSLDSHLHYESWDPKAMMPTIRIEVQQGESEAALVELGTAMLDWTRFRGRHEHDDDAEDMYSVEFKVLDFDSGHYGAHWVRVFTDATAQRVERRWSAMLNIDAEPRPLFDVLVDVRANWFYSDELLPDTSLTFGTEDGPKPGDGAI